MALIWESASASILGTTAQALNLSTVDIPDIEGNVPSVVTIKVSEIPADVPWTHVFIERRVDTDVST
eukprot:3271758-Lingulodinium_polyedra.AAC.1